MWSILDVSRFLLTLNFSLCIAECRNFTESWELWNAEYAKYCGKGKILNDEIIFVIGWWEFMKDNNKNEKAIDNV